MARWMTICIVACLLTASSALDSGESGGDRARPAEAVAACLGCHPSAARVLRGPMATRAGERAFAHRAFGIDEGDRVFDASCSGCHVTGCGDCHDGEHPYGRPGNETCLRCHNGYSVGWQFEGKAPREDHARYRRGKTAQGEPYLAMLPDVHFEKGMTCADCHLMSSLHTGGRAKACLDCHPNPAASVPEHSIAAHRGAMECVACHAAWAPQEYGTFLIRARKDEHESFDGIREAGSWMKSAHLKRQDAPPLGMNLADRVAPIRPQFILFVTDPSRGWENRLLAAEWRAFTPHTIRRGAVTCSGCHDNPRRFLLEPPADRIYRIDRDGLSLRSYWDREGQTVVNGSLMDEERHAKMNEKTPEYARQLVRQWQTILDHADPR